MFTTNQLQILAVLINQPDKEYYLSELGDILSKHPGVFQRGINSLERQGVIESYKRGNQRFFQINKSYVFYDEIKNIVQKTQGIEGLLKKLVNNIDSIDMAFIYGTYAKDKMRIDSDIDILIRTKSFDIEDYFLEGITKIEQKVQREINYKIYLKEEFNKKKKMKDAFLEEVLSDKYILLKGKI